MFVRNTPARTTSSKLLPAAFRTADRFWKTRSVSAATPPSTTLPVAGSWPTCPLKNRKPSILTAWENGPTGGASSGEVIAVLLMTAPVGPSAADQRHQRCSPPRPGDCSGTLTIPQMHVSHDDVAVGARYRYWLKRQFSGSP